MDRLNVNLNTVKNAKNTDVSKTKQHSQTRELAPFDTLEYVNKNDGITYVAKKLTFQQGDKTVNGVFVFAKDAKPDKNGQIQGEFMSVDTFLKKMRDEVPRVDARTVQSYNSNIKTMSPEEKFDRGYASGIELSDGTKLLRPTMLNSGTTEIKRTSDGNYDVIFTSHLPMYKGKTENKTVNESELRNDLSLYGGTIKATDDGNYEVLHKNFGNEPIILSKSETIKFLRRNHLHF